MRQLLNRFQPPRPWKDPEMARPLMYRTYPIMKDSGGKGRVYRTTEQANRLAQMMLYRWCRSLDFVEAPACGELYDYLIVRNGFPVSKKHFGSTIVNALDYECRKLKGVTKDNPVVRQLYYFESQLELQYGLEYMICSWLRKFLNDQSAPGSNSVSSPEDMEMELDMLAEADWQTFQEIYLSPQLGRDSWAAKEPDWRMLLKKSAVGSESLPPETEAEFLKEPERFQLKSYR